MTTTNVYQGLSGDKSTSRVLQAPGGGSSNIFGHYQAESDRERAQQHQRGTEAVMQSAAMGAQRNGGDASHNYQDNKDSFAANRQRNQGEGAPFATSNSMVNTPAEKVVMQAPVADGDYQTPKQQQAANRMRNHGSGAPFATGDFGQAPEQTDGSAQSHGTDYLTPQQRQANNPNKAGNSFSNLFGDSGPDGTHGKSKGKDNLTPGYLSPHYCLAVKPSPISGASPFLSPTPAPQRQLHPGYKSDLGILPSALQQGNVSHPHHPTSHANYQLSTSIIPLSDSQLQPSAAALQYQPHESIVPMAPVPCCENGTATPSDGHKSARNISTIERNPVTGEGLPRVVSSTIKCYSHSNASAGSRNPLTGSEITNIYTDTARCSSAPHLAGPHPPPPLCWDESDNMAALSLNDEIPLRSKGQGVFSQHQVSTHNPVTWEAYSNFDAAQDHPQHRSRFENFASTKAGTFNPITGEDHVASNDGKVSTKVHAPPGGQSSIQF